MLDAVFPLAVLLAVVNRAIVDYLTAPVRQRFPDADLWFLVYVSFVIGGVIGWLSGVNLFSEIPTMPLVLGRILTAASIGGGANLLHDLAKRRSEKPEPLDVEGVVLNKLQWSEDGPAIRFVGDNGSSSFFNAGGSTTVTTTPVDSSETLSNMREIKEAAYRSGFADASSGVDRAEPK